jgi:hypothetical protein
MGTPQSTMRNNEFTFKMICRRTFSHSPDAIERAHVLQIRMSPSP